MKKPLKIILYILSIILILFLGLFIFVSIPTGEIEDISYLDADINVISPQKVSVEGVKLITQPDGFICGETTICVTASFLNKADITPGAVIEKYSLNGGMKSDVFVNILSQEIPDYTVTYKENLGEAELLRAIHAQLSNGIPVPVFFGAANPYNKPKYDFHASVVTGLDLEAKKVHILNVYGYEEDITLKEFLNRMAFRGTSKYPFVQRAVLKFGLMKKNSFVAISEK